MAARAGRSGANVIGVFARELCEKYPAAPSVQLARMLRKRHPLLFHSVEQARLAVRYYRGSHGEYNRRHVKDVVERLEIPLAEETPFRVVELPRDVNRWLVVADLHCRYHDPVAVAAALEWGCGAKCDGVLILGDFLDFYRLSRFNKIPTASTLREEVECAGKILDAMVKHLNPKRIVYKGGNHENRLTPYLCENAPELYDLTTQVAVERAEKELRKRRCQWVPPTQILRHHALGILHGDEFGSGAWAPVSPARTSFLKATECALVGHWHRTSEYTQNTLSGETITTWSVGCLCNLHPQYRPLNNWNHGLALLETKGEWRVTNKRIVNGEVL